MTPHDRYRAYIHQSYQSVPMCATCRHYCQYYTMSGEGKFHPLQDGHCMTPRIKTRVPFDLCTYYDPREETIPWQDRMPSCAER